MLKHKETYAHILWSLAFVIAIIVSLGVSYHQGKAQYDYQTRVVNAHTNPLIKELKLNKYGKVRYYPRKLRFVFIANSTTAKEINHTKIGEKRPMKYEHRITEFTHKMRRMTHNRNIISSIKANGKEYNMYQEYDINHQA